MDITTVFETVSQGSTPCVPTNFMSYKLLVKNGRREYTGVPISRVNQLIDDLVHENNSLFKEITIVPTNLGYYNVTIEF